MSLLHDIEDWYEHDASPPAISDVEEVSSELVETLRWGSLIETVYHRGGEYVRVSSVHPATEMQEWGDYGPPEIESVEPYEVTVIKYRKV